jgi:hypothetical protein
MYGMIGDALETSPEALICTRVLQSKFLFLTHYWFFSFTFPISNVGYQISEEEKPSHINWMGLRALVSRSI